MISVQTTADFQASTISSVSISRCLATLSLHFCYGLHLLSFLGPDRWSPQPAFECIFQVNFRAMNLFLFILRLSTWEDTPANTQQNKQEFPIIERIKWRIAASDSQKTGGKHCHGPTLTPSWWMTGVGPDEWESKLRIGRHQESWKYGVLLQHMLESKLSRSKPKTVCHLQKGDFPYLETSPWKGQQRTTRLLSSLNLCAGKGNCWGVGTWTPQKTMRA